ncbi:Choline-sulfatase [hydrothermal vent metagenome]|uniref:Choline-sulfatase n=1 Tax=hydrothermal vent metagenome TaxID=652676 RepID=A0A3B0TV68_9ZZZZ
MESQYLTFCKILIIGWLAVGYSCRGPEGQNPESAAGGKAKPNIVYIFADQMRAQATGFSGNINVHTPKLDGLASKSVVFTTAVSTCPVCTPYRASLLTGQYPLTHGLFMNDLKLPDNGNSIGQVLKRSGYDTGWIGKWHLNGGGRSLYIPEGNRQGFEYWKVLECTHDYNKSYYYEGNDTIKKLWPGYDAYAQTNDAVEYINLKKHSSKPFALFISYGIPHDPYNTAPGDLQKLFREEDFILRENVPPQMQDLCRKELVGYYAHIAALDSCVGEIYNALEETGLAGNTIFVFTSDHGDMLESHWFGPGRSPRKQAPYDESILVPFILRYPALLKDKAKIIQTPIGTPDIMPTLLGLCGIGIPQTVEGESLSALIINGTSKLGREGVLIANYHPFADFRTERGGRPYRGIRTGRYTFVRDLNGPWMLFDNLNDPFQLENLVNKHSAKDTQARLDAELKEILTGLNDPFDRPEVLRAKWGYKINDNESIPYY